MGEVKLLCKLFIIFTNVTCVMPVDAMVSQNLLKKQIVDCLGSCLGQGDVNFGISYVWHFYSDPGAYQTGMW